MDDEIQLISDGDGLAVIGNPAAVDRFLTSEGLPSKDLGLKRLRSALGAGVEAAQVGSEIAANAGRWVKLTEKSAQAMRKYTLMKGSNRDVSRTVLTENGKIKGLMEIVKPGSFLTNPAVLAGAAGLMAQLAMQQTMEEITDYLAAIDEKVDDVLRGQKDAVVADMIGVDLLIEEAMTIREQVGRVSEVTWSKMQATPVTIARTQAYALRQLDAIAEKMDHKAKIGDLAKTSKEAEVKVQEWLAVLARCFQLQDAIAVLELDRVLEASPEELDEHRLALRAARRNRLELISRSTERLLARMQAAAAAANTKVLLHPAIVRALVHSSNHVATTVVDFHGRLGIERDRQSLEARRWADAAAEVRDKVLETGAEGLDVAVQLGTETFGRARSVMGRLSSEIAERALRQLGDAEGAPKRPEGSGPAEEKTP
ncbi:M3 family oligoendopeptidase [Microbispora hainanensis]|uniref:M3 family oligoendopeptidase n=1 Tax=Microbispora hainanensis TaxID=568844 RepID=A0A544YZV9_9ACTN|nr:M3 family oligoendopeptidase [Microbispora hainanensis]TQS22320.1 M3 family oligoendopeptidase [Microbispora hainanensis]